jgi:hypothetical protein
VLGRNSKVFRSTGRSGRNDPCPCGSGKKYKRCCLDKEKAPDGFSPDERRSAPIKLERFVEKELGPEDEKAWNSFYEEWEDRLEELDDTETEASEAVYDMWFFCDRKLTGGGSVVKSYLERGPLLSPGARRYLRLIRDSALRLYEVEDFSPGESITLVELPSGGRVTVHERTGSRSLWRHALLAARIIGEGPSGQPEIEFDLLNIPELIRDRLLSELAALREGYRHEHPAAAEIDFCREMGPFFHQVWISSVLDPQIPALKNTDGEDLLITRSRFDAADPAALEAALDEVSVRFRHRRLVTRGVRIPAI